MLKSLIAVAGIVFVGLQDTKTFSSSDLDLSFKYPKNWSLTSKKGDIKISIPIERGHAVVEIFATSFRSTPEDWQTIQANVNKTLRRELLQQWQEEILSVPLLLTKIRYQEGAEEMQSLIGLLYSARAKKMLFRLTSPSHQFAAVETAFREVLQSLQTTSGELPKPDNPETPLNPEALKPVTPRKPPVSLGGGSKSNPKGSLADQRYVTKSGGVDVELCYSKGWQVVASEGRFEVKNTKLLGQFLLEINSEIDSAKPHKALMDAAGKTLGQFSKVLSREETNPALNEAAASVWFVVRRGTTDLGDFVVWNAVGSKAGHYWLATYRGTYSQYQKDRRLVEEFMNRASVESK